MEEKSFKDFVCKNKDVLLPFLATLFDKTLSRFPFLSKIVISFLFPAIAGILEEYCNEKKSDIK